jgi:hypothetical protein
MQRKYIKAIILQVGEANFNQTGKVIIPVDW